MSRLSHFFLGLRHLGRGFGFLFKHPSLWPWVLFPWVLSILLLALSWGLFVHYYPDFYQFLLSHVGLQTLPEAKGFWGTLGFGGLWVVKLLLKVLLFLLGLILLSILTFLIYLILASPFLDLLAEKVTTLSQGIEPPPFQWGRFFKSLGRALIVESQKASAFLIVTLVFWILNFIPWIGSVLYITLTALFGMWGLGFFSVDFSMGHQFFTFKKRLQFAREFKYALIGFGVPFLIPFAPLLLQPPMVVGGTLLYHELATPSPKQY